MASSKFNTWFTTTKLTEARVDTLKKEDLDTEEALQLLLPTDLIHKQGQKHIFWINITNWPETNQLPFCEYDR